MPICKHCGEPIYQTRGGSWMHMDGRGHLISRSQRTGAAMSENAERERAIKAVGEEGYAARVDEDDYGQRRTYHPLKQDPAWPGVVNNWPIRGDE